MVKIGHNDTVYALSIPSVKKTIHSQLEFC